MTANYLVTYATRHGGTADIAQAIAAALRDCGQTVDVMSIIEVKDLAPYQGIFIGSAVQHGAVLPEVMDFVRRRQFVLSAMPVACFISCQTISRHTYQSAREVAEYLTPVRRIIRVQSEGYFGGVLDYNEQTSQDQRLLTAKQVPEGDYRNWMMIYRWSVRTLGLLAGSNTSAAV